MIPVTKRLVPALLIIPLALIGIAIAKDVSKLSKQPNIVLIFCDDHASPAISAYGDPRKLIETPNIDHLAKEGMLFKRCMVTSSICGPSRAAVLTGKYAHLNGFYNNETTPFDGSQQTFPKLLQKAGYQTAIIGKWHLVSDPTGFDHWEILPNQGQYYNPPMICDGKKVVHEGYVTDIITDLSMEWIRNRDKSKPFMLMCQPKAPHMPWEPALRNLDFDKDRHYPVPETFFDDYGNGRGKGACAATGEKEWAEGLAFEGDGVEDAADVGEGRLAAHEGRVHAKLELLPALAADGEVFDRVAEARGHRVIDGLEGADAFRRHVRVIHFRAEGEHREDDELVRRIVPVHVEGRVRFRVATGLGVREGFCEGGAIVAHAREDEVAGTVHDARELLDVVAGERVAEDANHGDSAANRRLEGEVRVLGRGEREEFGAALREEHLVRGDDGDAALETRFDALVGRVETAHDFHEDVEAFVVHDLVHVRREHALVDARDALFVLAPDRDLHEFERCAEARFEVGAVLLEELHDATTHDSTAEKANAHGSHDAAR